MKTSSSEWTAELERLLVRELLAEYRTLAKTAFEGALRPATLALVEGASRLGAWRRETRTLEISRLLVLAHPWGAVVEVLKHEMAHQYAHEVLGAEGETAHGAAFRSVCERLGIDAAASGLPRAPEADAERIVAKVARLLALAESPERHEAEAAAAAAQRLILKHNLEHAGARTYGFRQLGVPSGRTTEAQRLLAMILAKHFFVEVIWVPVYRPREGARGSALEICGTPENLAMAEHVHDFLTRTADRLFDESGLPRRERRHYLSGVMAGFEEKLARAARKHEEEGLVWVGDADLGEYYKRRHPRVRNVRYGGAPRGAAYANGRAAGRRIVLSRPLEDGPRDRAAPRLLGPRR